MEIQIELNSEEILSIISELDIFKYYCLNFKELDKPFSSEFREDPKPSCRISARDGFFLYKDFGETVSHNCWGYVMRKFSCDYRTALNIVASDFNLSTKSDIFGTKTFNIKPKVNSKNKITESKSTIIQIKKRLDSESNIFYRPEDLAYWNDFYWTEDMLRKSKTYPITHYFIKNHRTEDKLLTYSTNNERVFSYDYYSHKGVFRRKIYFPDRKDYKWISNVDNTTVQLVDVMPKEGDILFLTSSKKDAGIFWRMELDKMFPELIIHGVAANNEGAFVPEAWFDKKKVTWKRIILWYNNDIPGIENAKKYSEKYNIEYFYNPINEPKDPSDFSKKYSLYEFKNLINNLVIT